LRRARIAAATTLLLAAAFALGCHGEQVRLAVAPEADRYEWRDPVQVQRLRELLEELFYAVSGPPSYARALEPLEGFVVTARVRWNRLAEPLSAAFEELCRQHNEATIAIEQFDERMKALLALVDELKASRERLDAAVSRYETSQKALSDAAELTGRRRGAAAQEAARKMADARASAELILAHAAELVGEVTAP
jgi:predicted HTH domain antitoxin